MIIASNGQMIQQEIRNDFPLKIRRAEYFEPGPVLKSHWHQETMFLIVEKGTAIVHCNSQPFPVSPGDLIIIHSNDIHYVENHCHHLIEYYIMFDTAFLRSSRGDSCQTGYITPFEENRIRFQTHIKNDPELAEKVLAIFHEYENKRPAFELAIKSHLYAMFVLLFRNYRLPSAATPESSRHHQLRLVLQYVDNNYNQKITLEELAQMAHMSRHHFCRLFKALTGMPPIEYVNHLRINTAIKLLQQNRLSVSEAAQAVGFSDSNYFSRLFKKYKHVSPTNVKKEQA